MLDPDYKAFVIYVVVLNISPDNKIYPLKEIQIAYLKVDKALTKVSNKYIEFVDIFLLKLAIKLHEYLKINKYIIKLINN